MWKFYVYQYYTFFVLISSFLHCTTTYKMVSLEDYRLCMDSRNGEVKLGSEITSAVIVVLGNLRKPTFLHKKTFTCKFEVHSSKSVSYGIFAVIQQMMFRKNETTGDCIDFVQYETSDRKFSKKYCGHMNAIVDMDPIFRSSGFFSTNVIPTINSYVDPSASLTVHIYLNENFLHTQDELKLEIAFTTYNYCFPVNHNFKPCSVKFKDRCIYKSFFNDGIFNCPYPNCVDETACSENFEVKVAETKSVDKKVNIGSVIHIILPVVFLLLVSFVWICRKHQKLCWAEEFSQAITNEVEESPVRDVPISSDQNATFGLGVPPTEENIDLPPSYESLFPN